MVRQILLLRICLLISFRPSVPMNVQNSLLACLVDRLPSYFRYRDNQGRKRKRAGLAEDSDTEPPAILNHLTIGINQVTKRLESHVKSSRTVVVSDKPIAAECRSAIKIVFVCRADVDPPLLIAHLPHLVAACNTFSAFPNSIKLVPLPKGAEASLAEALRLRRVAVIAIDARFYISMECTPLANF